MSYKTYLHDFRRRFLTTMFISKLTLIIFNSSFILLDLSISTLLWLDIYRLPWIKVDLPDAELASMVATKKFGIILTTGIILGISSLGILGAVRGNTNMLITYDVIGLFAIIVLGLGWRNYQSMPVVYFSTIGALFISLFIALVLIKTIKDEPYRIRRELMLVNMAHMRESDHF